MNNPKICLIAAMSENRVIGKDNKLPWNIPEDLQHFKEVTSGHPVIMGRKTFESIGRLLPKRMNIIVTRDASYKVEGATIAHSLEQAIELAKNYEATPLRQGFEGQGEIFVIGGGQIFELALPQADRLYLTVVHTEIEGDAFFPEYKDFKKVISQSSGHSEKYSYIFLTLEK